MTQSNGTITRYGLDAAGNRISVVMNLDTTPPSVPTGLSATPASQSQINLSWTASTDSSGAGVAGYRIYRGGSQVATTAATTYNDVGLATYTNYAYAVAAYDNATPANVSAQSTAATARTLDQTPPSVPTGLSATVISQTQINLSWSPSTDGQTGVAGYQIFRNGSQVGTVGGAVTTYGDTGLTGFTNYSYTVAARDNATPANVSAQSTAAAGKTLDQTAPTVPTGLTATATSASQISLSWSPSTDSGGAGLAGYKVYRNGAQIASTASTSFLDTGLASVTTYTYFLSAYDNASPVNNSGPSASVNGTTLSTTITDHATLTQGAASSTNDFGFLLGQYGSMSPATTSNGRTYSAFYDHWSMAHGGGDYKFTILEISGFTADPGTGWLVSISPSVGSSTYSYSAGVATWTFHTAANFGGTGSVVVTIVHQ